MVLNFYNTVKSVVSSCQTAIIINYYNIIRSEQKSETNVNLSFLAKQQIIQWDVNYHGAWFAMPEKKLTQKQKPMFWTENNYDCHFFHEIIILSLCGSHVPAPTLYHMELELQHLYTTLLWSRSTELEF